MFLIQQSFFSMCGLVVVVIVDLKPIATLTITKKNEVNTIKFGHYIRSSWNCQLPTKIAMNMWKIALGSYMLHQMIDLWSNFVDVDVVFFAFFSTATFLLIWFNKKNFILWKNSFLNNQ